MEDIENALQKSSDIRMTRLNIIRKQSDDVYQAAKWLDENKHIFKNPDETCGPILAEVQLKFYHKPIQNSQCYIIISHY